MGFFQFRASAALFLMLLAVAGCKQKKRLIKSPTGYNFSKAEIFKLDLKLKEISGLVWDRERDEFLAHYDEKGTLFILDKETKGIKSEYSFGTKGDYEDVALYKGVPYVLRSDGVIWKIIRDSAGVRGVEAGKLGIGGTNDFETMYADTARKALILVCKNCAMDSKAEVSAFAFYPDSTGFDTNPVYRINADTIKKMSPHKTSKFQPSAASIHPVTQKLIIISSAASQFVICDQNGHPEQVFELGEKLFPQPEGLTFKSNGDMYISNEGVTGRATILRVAYNAL